MLRFALNCAIFASALFGGAGRAAPLSQPNETIPPVTSLASTLAPIRVEARLPALAGAIVTSRGLYARGVVGVRKADTNVVATIDDSWHLGSDTKAMTATLIGLLIDDGKLKFESSITEIFPDLAPHLPVAFRKVTVAQLLAHRAGLPHDANWRELSHRGSIVEQRRAAVQAVRDSDLIATPGEKYSYSNWDYTILGAIAEEIGGRPWEELIRQRVFEPLKMAHTAFGGLGTPGQVDQPWPHRDGHPLPHNGPTVDNLPVMAPAGAVHCPIDDWAKFIANELRGHRGEPNLLSTATFKRLHTPEFGGNYAGGWLVVQRPWAKGTAYTHAGSNTMNFAVVWLAPERDAAFLVCTNTADAAKPCDQAIGALIKRFNSTPP